jgi:SAM-dependent methyltransferase
MEITEAQALITSTVIDSNTAGHWLDLGCGTGTFTRALAGILPPGSRITAVDQDPNALRSIPASHAGIEISTLLADVSSLALGAVDGVLLANVLHFVKDQRAMLARLAAATSQVLLVEYDRTHPRPPWVPFPVSRERAITLFREAGYGRCVDLGSRASRYGPDPLYAMHFSR